MEPKFKREGNTLYSLMFDSYSKGKEQFKNEFCINFTADREISEEKLNQLIEGVLNFLNEHA